MLAAYSFSAFVSLGSRVLPSILLLLLLGSSTDSLLLEALYTFHVSVLQGNTFLKLPTELSEFILPISSCREANLIW